MEYSAIEEGSALRAGEERLASSLKHARTADSDRQALRPRASHRAKGLKDVIRQIKADRAWAKSRGEGVHIAIVDTGVCGEMKEFPEWKRSPFSTDRFGNPWGDVDYHGSMVACIAAGTSAAGGRFDGVAPDATLISCRVPFGEFDEAYICPIYEHLIQLVEKGEIDRLVINNSWALRGSGEPKIDPSNSFLAIVRKAVNLGIVVVFAAGDNNTCAEADSKSKSCPNTIWGANSLDEVITVGTVDESGSIDALPRGLNRWEMCHRNGSWGPGQFARATIKPDCVAPTYGEVMWGRGYQSMVWWGTSGAAPQVSGLAALLLARDASLTPGEIKEIIRCSCVSLALPPESAGAGMIDCERALALLESGKARTESFLPTSDFGEPAVRFAGLPPITAAKNDNLKEIRQ
jgi:subtilisin family serine protease